MLRHLLQKMAILPKSPWLQCFIYDNICNTIIKSPGQIRSKPGVTVPRCTSHCLASIKQMFSNMLPNINVTKRHNSVCIQQVRSYVHPIKTENQLNQLDWFRGSDEEETVKKILLTDVAEQIKPVYKTNCSRKKNFDRRITTSVPKKVFCIREKLSLAKDKDKQIWDKKTS